MIIISTTTTTTRPSVVLSQDTISLCGNEQHAVRTRFTRKGNKWANVLDRMINTGKTMRQIYRYCQVWLSDIGATDFSCPKFNQNASMQWM